MLYTRYVQGMQVHPPTDCLDGRTDGRNHGRTDRQWCSKLKLQGTTEKITLFLCSSLNVILSTSLTYVAGTRWIHVLAVDGHVGVEFEGSVTHSDGLTRGKIPTDGAGHCRNINRATLDRESHDDTAWRHNTSC